MRSNRRKAGTSIVLAVGLAVLTPLLMGFESCQKPAKQEEQRKITYRSDCTFVDFYGGVEMQSWAGSGHKHHSVSTDPFGALSYNFGELPAGIGVHVQARSLTPVARLPKGSRPNLECKLVRVDHKTGRELTIAGPAHTNSRRVWLYVPGRAS